MNLWSETDLELLMLLKGNPFQKCKVMAISCHEIIFYILVSTISFCFQSYFGRALHLILLVSIVVEKLIEFYVLFFLLLKVGITCYIFFHFTLIIVLNVRSSVNDKFSNLISNVFIITGFISSNKKMDLPQFYKGIGGWSSGYSPKHGGEEGNFFS